MITVPGISLGDADTTRSLLAVTAEVAVSTGARNTSNSRAGEPPRVAIRRNFSISGGASLVRTRVIRSTASVSLK